MYDKQFGRRMDCLNEHYNSVYEDSSEDEEPQKAETEIKYRDIGIQTNKKTNLHQEIETLNAEGKQLKKKNCELHDRLYASLNREKALKKEVNWLHQCLFVKNVYQPKKKNAK